MTFLTDGPRRGLFPTGIPYIEWDPASLRAQRTFVPELAQERQPKRSMYIVAKFESPRVVARSDVVLW